jgi:hypothetical protein
MSRKRIIDVLKFGVATEIFGETMATLTKLNRPWVTLGYPLSLGIPTKACEIPLL